MITDKFFKSENLSQPQELNRILNLKQGKY